MFSINSPGFWNLLHANRLIALKGGDVPINLPNNICLNWWRLQYLQTFIFVNRSRTTKDLMYNTCLSNLHLGLPVGSMRAIFSSLKESLSQDTAHRYRYIKISMTQPNSNNWQLLKFWHLSNILKRFYFNCKLRFLFIFSSKCTSLVGHL